MSPRRCLTGMLFLLAWFSPLAALAASHEETAKAGNFSARLHIDSTKITILDKVTLTVSLEGPAPFAVDPIVAITSSPLWQISPDRAEMLPLSTAREGNKATTGQSRWQQVFRLEPRQPGKTPLPINPLRFRPASSEKGKPNEAPWQEVSFKPVEVEVTTTIANPSLSEMKPITSIEEVPPRPEGSGMIWLFAGIGVTLVVMAGLIGIRRYRHQPIKTAPEPPPDQKALRQLDHIAALDLAQAGQIERFHTLASEVLRQYLEARFGLGAPRQTTPEFLASLGRSTLLPEAEQDQLRNFLTRCDLAKFARADFSAEECHTASQLARAFVQETASLPTPGGSEKNPASSQGRKPNLEEVIKRANR